MPDMKSLYDAHKDLSEDAQKQAGQAIGGAMKKEHEDFLQLIVKLVDEGKIDLNVPSSLLNQSVYDELTEEWKMKVDTALLNIAHQIRLMYEFFTSTATPNSSPHLVTMIDHLHQMKSRIEKHADIFKI